MLSRDIRISSWVGEEDIYHSLPMKYSSQTGSLWGYKSTPCGLVLVCLRLRYRLTETQSDTALVMYKVVASSTWHEGDASIGDKDHNHTTYWVGAAYVRNDKFKALRKRDLLNSGAPLVCPLILFGQYLKRNRG